jgi:hypothetical protein
VQVSDLLGRGLWDLLDLGVDVRVPISGDGEFLDRNRLLLLRESPK